MYFVYISVIASEGYVAPYVGILKTGECHVLRQVEVLQTLPNGKKVHVSTIKFLWSKVKHKNTNTRYN